MYVIVVYDMSLLEKRDSRRYTKLLKLLRRNLHHTQKSVFEGELTLSKLLKLEIEIKKLIKDNLDQLIIYIIENKNNVNKKIIGINYDSSSNIL